MKRRNKKHGPVRESNPGPLAPKERIMPLEKSSTQFSPPVPSGCCLQGVAKSISQG